MYTTHTHKSLKMIHLTFTEASGYATCSCELESCRLKLVALSTAIVREKWTKGIQERVKSRRSRRTWRKAMPVEAGQR